MSANNLKRQFQNPENENICQTDLYFFLQVQNLPFSKIIPRRIDNSFTLK